MLCLNDLDACKYANIQLTSFPDEALDEKYYTQMSITMTRSQTYVNNNLGTCGGCRILPMLNNNLMT